MAGVDYLPAIAHIRLKVTGSSEKVAAFHWVMGTLDPDYPYGPPRLRRAQAAPLMCELCGGLVYRTPMFTATQMKEVAKQINESNRLRGHLKVQVRMFNLRCPGKVGKVGGATDERRAS